MNWIEATIVVIGIIVVGYGIYRELKETERLMDDVYEEHETGERPHRPVRMPRGRRYGKG
jgi:hypothetical protein